MKDFLIHHVRHRLRLYLLNQQYHFLDDLHLFRRRLNHLFHNQLDLDMCHRLRRLRK
jgi:hypothetical protein